MNFEFSEDQQLMRDVARKFLAEQCDLNKVRAILDSEQRFDRDIWQQIAEMGWTGIAIDEDHGGAGMSHLDLCVIAEELGRALAPVPFGPTVYLAAEGLARYGNDAQRQQWLPTIAAGDALGCAAITEQLGPLTRRSITTRWADGKLDGEKIAVANGADADVALVLARASADELTLCLVDLGQAGVTRTEARSVDPSSAYARLKFDRVAATRLGTIDGLTALSDLYDRAAVLVAFEQLGGAHAALDMAVEFCKTRYAFGRAIGSFQALKHRLADMFVSVELARSNCYYAAWALNNDAPELPVAAAGARIAATQANYLCSKESIQLHGGMGFTWEADCHLFYRRAKALSLLLGGERVWKNKLIERLQRQSKIEPAAARQAA